VSSTYYLPAGTGGAGDYDLEVTPESAGWGFSSLRILNLEPDHTHQVDTGSDEIIVLPLSGSCSVEVKGTHLKLNGRTDVFAGPSDFAYLPINQVALCGSRTDKVLPLRYQAADTVPVELRGAGQSSRQVRNFGTPDSLDAGAIIACEVITPGGNWSSYPAHKHDEATDTETKLEEIYYFQISAGPNMEPGLGYMRTSSSPGHEIDILAEVHDCDTVLVPFGWHGPCAAAPGYDMYYLNIMAGPSDERAWLISDHPDQTWVRDAWKSQSIDPRLLEKG